MLTFLLLALVVFRRHRPLCVEVSHRIRQANGQPDERGLSRFELKFGWRIADRPS